MDSNCKVMIWNQYGAAIETLKKAITTCPEELWFDDTKKHKFWYLAYHTLFWMDYYLSNEGESFRPPEPFGLEELDPAGVLPERPYTKAELLGYLGICRNKCRETIFGLTEDSANKPFQFKTATLTFAELLLYDMRHVQHHAAQLNMLLRQNINTAPGWVFQAE